MANRIIERMVTFDFEYITPVEITIEETSTGVAMVRGTLLKEGKSKNGNLYTINEMANIAKQAEGLPIYVGTKTKLDPNLGVYRKNMHADDEPNKIGKILKATLNMKDRAIKFIAEIVNTVNFPDIITRIKKGWGISIGGVAKKAKLIIEESGKIVTKVLGLVLKSAQLLSPETIRGQDEAMVEDVEIQESMIFYEEAPLDEVTSVIPRNGIKRVKVHIS